MFRMCGINFQRASSDDVAVEGGRGAQRACAHLRLEVHFVQPKLHSGKRIN